MCSVPAVADVQDDFEVVVIEKALGGKDMPGLVFKGIRPIYNVVVTVTRANGPQYEYTRPLLQAGEEWKVTWKQEPGRALYHVDFKADGMTDWLEVNFAAEVAQPFDLTVDSEDIDLAAGRIGFLTIGRVSKVQMFLYAPNGDLITSREQELLLSPGRQKGFEFKPPEGEIGQVALVASSGKKFHKEVTFTPYSVPVPHDEVLFEFGKADIRPCEEPKLEVAMKTTKKVLSTLGKQIKFKLYVAGYTDTVGSHALNMDLSRRRAAAIATWLQAHGLRLHVCSRGFGESILAVKTPDETPEEANRRTVFVIAGQAPFGTDFAGPGKWNCN